MIIGLLQTLSEEFRTVLPESYLEWNNADQVVYPYLTYSVQREAAERHSDTLTVDIDIFDNSSSYKGTYEVEEKLNEYFKWRRTITDDALFIWSFVRSQNIPTGDESIKRRQVTLSAKIDWRK
ncbi:hypothetical protein [Weissella cibaria]|uniref:hypothetical protein n=1 Tax=Weissella cibaria TaxID=137591 RepID=UPI00215B33E1|nr:hypothetical protein [Weissella cibaria]MCR8704182.1 hypothetical protein [Weissella cibaria]